MRKLNLTDVFRFSRLVKTSGMKDLVSNILHNAAEAKARQKPVMDAETIGKTLRTDLSDENTTDAAIGATAIRLCSERANNDSDLYSIGIDAFMSIVDVAAKNGVESSVYEFLAPVWEMTADEVANLSLETVVENLRKMFAENDFAAFFRKSEALTR